jgi:putative transposase
MDAWAYGHGIRLDFIRPGKPVENEYIESFDGRLRDECLNVSLFFSLEDAGEKLEAWQQDYNLARPHSALGDQAPKAFAIAWSKSASSDSELTPSQKSCQAHSLLEVLS